MGLIWLLCNFQKSLSALYRGLYNLLPYAYCLLLWVTFTCCMDFPIQLTVETKQENCYLNLSICSKRNNVNVMLALLALKYLILFPWFKRLYEIKTDTWFSKVLGDGFWDPRQCHLPLPCIAWKSNVLSKFSEPEYKLFWLADGECGAQNSAMMISALITLTFFMHCLDLQVIPLAGWEISCDQILGL